MSADLTATIRRRDGDGAFTLEFKTPHQWLDPPRACTTLNDVTVCTFTGRTSDLKDENSRLQDRLDRVRANYYSGTQGDLQNAGRQLVQLSKDGGQYLDNVFGPEAVVMLRTLLRHATGALDRPARFEIEAPVDLHLHLGLISTRTIVERTSWDEGQLEAAAGSFPAFGAVIQQRIRSGHMAQAWSSSDQQPADEGIIDLDHAIPTDFAGRAEVLFIWDPLAPRTREELAMLRELETRGRIKMGGPRPNWQDTADPGRLVSAIATPGRGSDTPHPSVIHVTAHSTTDPRVGEGSIDLRVNGKRFKITGGDLRQEWEDRGSVRLLAGPIGVLSSCEGAASIFLGVGSLVQVLLLRVGYRAVVGAEARVMGSLSEWFSGYLYEALMQHRLTLGHAVQRARVRLLRRHANPLGFLFTLYGDADLSLPAVSGGHGAIAAA